MRQRTRDEIKACEHAPLVEVGGYHGYAPHGEYIYAVMGCPKCGGTKMSMRAHINQSGSKGRKKGELDRIQGEEDEAYRTMVRTWREGLPEPEGEGDDSDSGT